MFGKKKKKEELYSHGLWLLRKRSLGIEFLDETLEIGLAIEYFDKALEIDPNDEHVLASKGEALAKRGIQDGCEADCEEALEYFNKALAINPNNFDAKMGKICLKLYRYGGEEIFEEVRETLKRGNNI